MNDMEQRAHAKALEQLETYSGASPVMELPKIPKITTSYEDPLELELKLLPEHLEYAFLREELELLVIFSLKLEPHQKE